MHQRTRRGFAVRTLLLAAVLTICQAAYSQDENKVVALINRIRKERHLQPLKVSRELNISAQRYAGYMASKNFFGHTGPDGSTIIDRNTKAGYRNWSLMAENIAAGYETPEEVVEAWMKSPAHRANILSKELREIGVGHACAEDSYYGHYWVQEFGARQSRPAEKKGKTKPPAP